MRVYQAFSSTNGHEGGTSPAQISSLGGPLVDESACFVGIPQQHPEHASYGSAKKLSNPF